MRKWMKIANKIRFQKRSPENRWVMYPSGHMLACRISSGTKPSMWETPVMKGHQNIQTLQIQICWPVSVSHEPLIYLPFWIRDTRCKAISCTSYHTQENNKDPLSCTGAALGFNCNVTKCSLFNLSDLSGRCSVFCRSKGKVNIVTLLKSFILGYKWPIPSRHHFLHAHSEFTLAQQGFWFREDISPKSRAAMVGHQSTSQSTLLLPTYRYVSKDLETSVWFSTHFTGL